MEKKFKNLLKISKAHENHETPLSNTFEFNLFRSSSWFLAMNNWGETVKIKTIPEHEAQSLPFKIKVLIVGDTYKGEGEDLLAKMLFAMKLQTNEYLRIPMDPDFENIVSPENNISNPSESFLELINLIEDQAPLFVISMGATITNLLLGRREKMSGIHGKYLKINAGKWEYQLMPIFHPDFLIINPNMKRTTWNDLQKIMESLGKI